MELNFRINMRLLALNKIKNIFYKISVKVSKRKVLVPKFLFETFSKLTKFQIKYIFYLQYNVCSSYKPVSFLIATKWAVRTLLLDPVVETAVKITVSALVVISELIPSEYLTAHVTEHVPVKWQQICKEEQNANLCKCTSKQVRQNNFTENTFKLNNSYKLKQLIYL